MGTLGTLIAIFAVGGSAAGARAPAHATSQSPAVTPTVLVVGDSVARMYSSYFTVEAARHGYSLVAAAWPGCPATGVAKVLSTGKPFKRSCSPQVANGQDAALDEYRPALVIWWSRYELAPRLGPNGNVLRVGSRAWFREQEASFNERVAALTRFGARLVAVQIEPPGPDLAVRNPGEHYFLVGHTLLHRPGVVNGWNAFLGSHDGPDVFSISVRNLVCHNERFPCDDRLADGKSARPDGVHYSAKAMRLFAPVIFKKIWRVAGLQSATTP
jgi:SGNH domain (fused to AT3 domains)